MNKLTALVLRLLLLAAVALPAGVTAAAQAHPFPSRIDLPNGWQPEGIAHGRGNTIYVGSIPTGAIYQADVRTGQGSILVPPQDGRAALGLGYDPRTNYIYVAGFLTGKAFVYDAATGATVAIFTLTTEAATVINDVAITEDAVYFTDTFRPVFYRLPLRHGGRLPDQAAVQEIPLSGDFPFLPDNLNSNGIVATPDGKYLIINHTGLGRLYRVNPTTGWATQIEVGVDPIGQDGSDGLVLAGQTLYVVDYYNQVIQVRLNSKWLAGKIKQTITDPGFDRPTTAALIGDALYVVASRSDTPATPDTPYWIQQVSRGGGDD